MIRKLLLFTTVLTSQLTVYSQTLPKEKKQKQLPSLAIGAGVLSFNGDVGNGVNLSSFSRIRGGYCLTIEQRVGKYFGVSLNGIYGKLADSDNGILGNRNFQTPLIQGDLNFVIHFDNDFIMDRSSVFAPYLFAGIGFMTFDPHGDLTDKNGVKYNYWSDGTIRNLPETDPMAATAVQIQRDYTFETKLTDSTTNYARHALSIPVGGGLNLKLTDNIGMNITGAYYFTLTDWVDNVRSGKNDRYIYAHVALKYSFGKAAEDNDPRYNSVDFSSLDKMDTDGDGVNDGDDRCPGTPAGVKVNRTGCPDDSDNDGVPDYRDKEPNSAKGALVDEFGVTQTDQMIAQQQAARDSLATERSELFNENPSMSFLKSVDDKAAENRKNNPNTSSKIPAALKSADVNSDGYISSDEITKAIDAFFEGESDFTVEKLNDLIDYFFEQ